MDRKARSAARTGRPKPPRSTAVLNQSYPARMYQSSPPNPRSSPPLHSSPITRIVSPMDQPYRTPDPPDHRQHSNPGYAEHDQYHANPSYPQDSYEMAETPYYDRNQITSSPFPRGATGYEDRYTPQDEGIPLIQNPSQASVLFQGNTAAGPGYNDYPQNVSLDDRATPLWNTPSSDPSSSAFHYGSPLPEKQLRRYNTTKRVELYQGNLVFDCPVSQQLLQTLPRRDDREFTHMRYTAATCDPMDFKSENFTLRQVIYEQPRPTELFIVITMYNEDEILFARTMHGVMKNIAHLCSRDRSRMWGKEGWRKAVVCIVSDGRTKINPRTLSLLAAMGVYQDGVAKNIVNGKEVTAHIYEYTTQISIDPDMKFKGVDKGIVPVQILFCLKEKNQKKINSHRWFFQAFGPILNPNVCILLDAGTMPGATSIYHLWKAFDINSNVAGACGEIVALKGKGGVNLLNPLVAAQNFEYKTANILDKPMESVFGFISVLPGAFSAYRYIALQNDITGRGPLASYFKGEKLHGSDAGIFEANMYLAEDRILCFELVAKRKCAWVLQYVKSAYAVTDVPDQLPELISQRRRWLNGSFFAAVYAIVHMFDIWRSSHGLFRKIFFHIEFLYQLVSMVFSWFALGNFFLTYVILTSSMGQASIGFAPGKWIFQITVWIYAALIVMSFVLSMGNRPQGSKLAYTSASIFFATLMGYMLFSTAFLTTKAVGSSMASFRANDPTFGHNFSDTIKAVFGNPVFRDLVLSLTATFGCYVISSLLFLDPWHIITSMIQYLLLSPTYVNILNVYAFCNTHDVSWGTKGDNVVNTDLGVVKTGKEGHADLDMPTDTKDINRTYAKALDVLATSAPPEEHKRDANTKQQDYYKAFRTRVVLFWVFCNAALVAAILNAGGKVSSIDIKDSSSTSAIYMGVLLWSTAGLSFFRFIGSVFYLIARLFNS